MQNAQELINIKNVKIKTYFRLHQKHEEEHNGKQQELRNMATLSWGPIHISVTRKSRHTITVFRAFLE